MSNKITCTCGHSWNKSDSSKKDATVCHICGKDNVMQMGGFVYPVNYVPQKKNGGWLDAYADDVPEAQNGIEGTMGGLTDKGFNYNGAWGGTMQMGGELKFLEPTSRKLPMGHVIPMSDPSTELAISVGGEDGEPAYLIPSFKYGKYLIDKDAKTEFRKTGEHLGGPFKTWQEADEWERTVRHPYVEKGQNIPTPFKRWGKDFAMGGSMPGSVGFTYARTQGIPSEGPYAKKTMASAQNGKPIKKREDFEPWWNWASKKAGDVDNRQDAFGTLGDLYAYYAGQPLHYNTLEHSQYKPTNAKNPNASYISINDPKFKQEVFDKYQDVFIKGKLKTGDVNKGEHPWHNEEKINDNTYAVSGYTRPTKEELEEARKQKVSPTFIKGKNYVSNAIGRYFISKGKDDKGEYISYYDVFDEGSGPDGGGMGETLGLTKPFEIYDRIYLDPKTGKPKMQNGGEMKFYQEGLDWKPKTISQDGTAVKKPRTDMLTMDEYRLQKALAEQPVIQSPKGKQLSKEEINKRNKEYAQQTGKKFDEKTGKVSSRFSPQQEKTLKKVEENILLPMLELEGVISGAPLLGSGVRQGLKAIGKNLVEKTALKNAEKKSIGYELRQIADIFNPKNLKTESGTDFMKSWYSDPDFARRYVPTGRYETGVMQQHILDQLKEYEPKNYIDLLKDKGVGMYLNKSATTGGVSWGVPKKIYVNRSAYAPFNKKGLESVRAHELTHLIENNGNLLSYQDESALLKPFGIDPLQELPKPSFFKKLIGDNPKYYLDPTEIHARMNQARFDLGLSPKDAFTEKMFSDVAKKKDWYGMGKYIKDKKGFVDLMNNFWAVPPAVIGATALDQQRDGGITKDDDGYWNPENWGKPVEIGSNNITMKGLQEMGYNNPLLGISDTGDTQMMYPGEDYTFDGESVTEYPVMQQGGNVPVPTRADSIMLLKNSILKNAFYKNNPNYTKVKSSFDFKDPKLLQKLAKSSVDTNRNYNYYKNSDEILKPDEPNSKEFTITAGDIKRKTGKVAGSSNVYSAPDIMSGVSIDTYFNPASPPILFSPNILPQGAVVYHSTKSSGYGDVAESPYYDPLAVAPWDMLTPQQQKGRLKQYGISGTPYDSTKQSPPQSTKPKLENDSYIKKYPPIYLDNPKDPRIGQYTEKGNQYLYKKPKQSVEYKKPKSKQEVVKKQEPTTPPPVKKEQPKPIERKQNVYEGSPVYSPGAGTGMGSALIGFLGQQGDTTYIKPEDYERFAVPKYGKEFIESKSKKKNGGWLEKYN